MDEKLVIPKDLREALFRCVHCGDPGRDAMLREAADISSLDSIEKLRGQLTYAQNAIKGKNIKPILRKSQYGKLEEPENVNDEIALDFANHTE